MMTITGYTSPMTSKVANRMELLNEAFVLIFTYHLYQFTDFMPDLENRNLVGKSLIVITILNVSVNMGTLFISNLTVVALKLKYYYQSYA